MPAIYYSNIGSQQSTILQPNYTRENLENIIGEVYCYGVDNYDNDPPKFIEVVSQDGQPIYNGKLEIPENGNISLEPELTEQQQQRIKTENTVVKTAPSQFGDETDTEYTEDTDTEDMEGGKRRRRKSRKNISKRRTIKRSKKSYKNHTRKNVARGQYSRRLSPLRKSNVTAPSAMSKTRGKSRLRTLGQSTRSVRPRVQINTPENLILEYTLGSSEKEMKQKTPIKGIQNCKNPTEEDDFPCKMKRTVFKNKKDYDKFKRLKKERNVSTGYKSRGEHYDEIEQMLMTQGYDLLRK